MGIFDFFTKGPALKRSDAERISVDIAINLKEKELEINDLAIAGDKILEFYFRRDFPENSISPDQSKQILKYALFMFENHDEYLSQVIGRSKMLQRRLEEDPNDLYIPSYAPYKNDPWKFTDSFLSNFKK